MIRILLEWLAKNPTPRTAPGPVERGLLHIVYWMGFLLLAAVVARAAGVVGFAAGTGTIFTFLMGVAALPATFMFWAVTMRRPPPENWFVSHLVWLTMSWAWLALAFLVSLLVLIAVAMLANAMPKIAVMLYAPLAIGAVLLLWFAYRHVRGYLALLRGEGVGNTPIRPGSFEL